MSKALCRVAGKQHTKNYEHKSFSASASLRSAYGEAGKYKLK
ncbi:hypothetical protein IX307_002208 [Bacteroides pyogenes]|nr:hypothetical protein [Bacteroides pyogenes]MBR8725122.1 hypothetical protein [Bacteroides pyogenes]MBR8738591.1 hypothetical protein [Bacteroides pyogenes]MBR8754325.1 hypothetical protein [Bacteroides pyogenes]MBR8787871.1 hypothetical protein [Bacteroides pyogenes]